MATMCVNGLMTLLFAASRGHESMILLRFLTGVGCGGSVPVVFALPAESVPASFRGSAITVVATFWMVGSITVASLAWALIPWYGWRVFAAGCAVPPLACALVVHVLVHESPRYLLVQGNVAQAGQVVGSMQQFSGFCGESLTRSASAHEPSVRADASVRLRPLQSQNVAGGAPQTRMPQRAHGPNPAPESLRAAHESH